LKDLRFVVDGEDRIVQVAEEDRETLGPYLGHPLWTYLAEAEPLLAPYFDEARATGDVVESTIFYAGGTYDVHVEPPEGTPRSALVVRLLRRTELDVRTLATLEESLRTIEAELAARAPARRGRRAPESRRAPP
jgi:hypothetical protein